MVKKIIYIFLCFVISFSAPVSVYSFDRIGTVSEISGNQSEYKNSNRNNRLLIEVNVLSGIQQKGIHQVPDNTNLVDMVSLAGGPEANADLSEVHIKRKTKSGFTTLSYDLESLVENSKKSYPPLEDGDVILIERSSTQAWQTGLSIFAVSLGIIVSSVLLYDRFKK